MNYPFETGILVGVLIAYIAIMIVRPRSKKIENPRWYIDDKTKVYLLMAIGLIIILLYVLLHHQPAPDIDSKAMLNGK